MSDDDGMDVASTMWGDDDFDHNDGFGWDEAWAAGTGYAFFRHGQDQQTRQIVQAIGQRGGGVAVAQPPIEVNVYTDEDRPGVPFVNAMEFSSAMMPTSWDDFIGQEPMKKQLAVHMQAAKIRDERFPHTLLATGQPGAGKTYMCRLIAATMGVPYLEIVPPFNIYTLVDAIQSLPDKGVVGIDEIHILSNNGKRGAEILLKILEDGVAYLPDGSVAQLPDVTIIGATTDRDKLPETILDRFKVKPFYQSYSLEELVKITMRFCHRHDALAAVTNQTAVAIAKACRGTPRIAEEFVMAAHNLYTVSRRPPEPAELLEFVEVTPDGMTRQHILYLTSLREFFPRTKKDTEEVEYVAGEASMLQIVRETKPGLSRIENFLITAGLVDRTPRGRRLTAQGVLRAETFIKEGRNPGSQDAPHGRRVGQ